MKQSVRLMAVVAVMLMFGALVKAQDPSQAPSNQQVQDPSQPKRPLIKATGTPQQAIPTQTSSHELPDEQQATKEQIEELLDVMRVEDQMDDMLGMLPQIIEQQQQGMSKAREVQGLTAAQKEQVEKLNKKYAEKATDIYSVNEMLADLTKLYQNHLNSNDVESLIAFYSSDAGQHLLDAQPLILKEYLPLMTARIVKRSADLQMEEKKEMDALLASFKGAGRN